ncbi:DUF6898 family protein [Kordiimonas marina]|uniref:DUF6898 family protein n=1 Tax=Kordiimonas marina TaxID=2872312 RepID=UPI001FF5DD4C|nr:hypothetical protein [Kordiimonas marina]MCJ9430392.1 hypothetical protein [Kordiimonas marina]
MPETGEVLIEITQMGNSVRVCAVCTRTGTEVSIVGDPRASRRELEMLAMRKLQYVMNRDEKKPVVENKKGLIV